MKKLISCCLLGICLSSYSQNIDVSKPYEKSAALINTFSASGTPYIDAKFVRMVSGSPFFDDKMMQGILISITGIEYRELAIRLNLMESHINFLNDKQVEMLVAIPIRELTLLDTLNKKKYHFIHSDFIETYEKTEKGFYQVLQKGKACLYSFYKKTIKETRAFNAATFEQSIQTDVTHLVLLDGRWKKFNKIKSLPSLLSDKKNEVQKYIDKNDLSGYKQEDVKLVIQYYNCLFESKL